VPTPLQSASQVFVTASEDFSYAVWGTALYRYNNVTFNYAPITTFIFYNKTILRNIGDKVVVAAALTAAPVGNNQQANYTIFFIKYLSNGTGSQLYSVNLTNVT
jgi:hypothetical protein